jgi:hypothetical protein
VVRWGEKTVARILAIRARWWLSALALALVADRARADDPPSIVAAAGMPSLPLGEYDLAKLGCQVEEFFVSGAAKSYRRQDRALVPAKTAPCATRLVVLRPSDPTDSAARPSSGG